MKAYASNGTNWHRATLGEALPVKYGKARNYEFGFPRLGTSIYGSNGPFDSFDRALTKGPTLIVGRKGAAGAVHYSADPCWPIDTAFYAEGREGYFLPFFRYLLESLKLGSLDRSTAIPSLSRDDYHAKVIHYPQQEEDQRQIVADIEKQFTRLDAGVAALKRVQANLKRYRASVLKAACEGRLVPTEAELARAEGRSYEPADQLLARSVKDFDPTAALLHHSEGWMQCKIGSILEVCIGSTPSRKRPEYWNGSIAWVSSGEVAFCKIQKSRECITSAGLENSSVKLHPPGTVLLAMIGEGKTRGQAALLEVEAANSQNSAALRPSAAVIPTYLYYFLCGQYEQTRKTSSGNNQPALNKGRVQQIDLPIPPLAEQTRIVADIDRRLSVIDQLESAVTANLQRAGRLRQSILQRAFVEPCRNREHPRTGA